MHSKSIRNERLKNQVKNWINAVDKWTSETDFERVKGALQLPRSWSQNARIFRVVVSRHYAYPLKEVVAGEDSAFANWLHFFNAAQIAQQNCQSPTLKNLVAVLKDSQEKPQQVTHLPEPTTKWKVSELVFLITQEAS